MVVFCGESTMHKAVEGRAAFVPAVPWVTRLRALFDRTPLEVKNSDERAARACRASNCGAPQSV
jgi:hypothetical protein